MAGMQRTARIVTPSDGNTVARVEIYEHTPGWPEWPERLRSAIQLTAEAMQGIVTDEMSQRP